METGRRRRNQVRHRAEDLDEWAQSLHRRFGGPIAVAVELSKGPIINVLQKYDFFVIYPIDPSKLANHRKTFTTSDAKDDPTDAEFVLKLLLSHAEHFKPLNPQSVEMRTLMTLVEHRWQLMNDRVRITNRLRNALKQYYPQPLEWFDHIDTLLFCDFIRRWQCSTFLRQTFIEWAAQTINKSYWAGLYYHQQRTKGCSMLENPNTVRRNPVSQSFTRTRIAPAKNSRSCLTE
jgi:hypothetical protein